MALVSALKSHKEDFEKAYSIHYPKLVRFAQTYVLTLQDAENIVQDVFLHLWENLDKIDTLINIDAFIFMSVKNRCIDYLRKQTQLKQKEQPLSELLEKELQLNLYSLQVMDENILTNEEIRIIVADAIHSLPERCREIFILNRIEGLRHKEIAAQLNISTNTVEGQMSIALRKLRAILKDRIPICIFFTILISSFPLGGKIIFYVI
ncbi:MAG: RNA polymerase sigma-70 factor [Tannerellaceae bacterium]|jgi:RNA polymerase sigma-70 factor (ECF subfamily)|nr:RNA polymerase sigma-70 factor [Tannerellaceae bacterium]